MCDVGGSVGSRVGGWHSSLCSSRACSRCIITSSDYRRQVQRGRLTHRCCCWHILVQRIIKLSFTTLTRISFLVLEKIVWDSTRPRSLKSLSDHNAATVCLALSVATEPCAHDLTVHQWSGAQRARLHNRIIAQYCIASIHVTFAGHWSSHAKFNGSWLTCVCVNSDTQTYTKHFITYAVRNLWAYIICKKGQGYD